MGQFFQQGGLTQPGSALQGADGSTTIGAPDKILGMADKALQSRVHPGDIGQQDMSGLPKIGQPSFQQAATAGATPGGANAMSPGLNKAGKLATLLTSGLQGALAGRAKSEETVAATGGRRSGGAGMGFEAGYELPWQRQAKQLGLQQQQAQVEATKAQSQMINTPSGPMPAWLAKAILPASIRGQSTENAAETRAGATTEAAGIAAGGRTKAADITGQYRMKALAAGTAPITQDDIQQYGLPPEFLGKVMKPSEVAGLQRAQNQQTTTVQGAAGPALVNKRTAKTTPLGLGVPSMGGIVPVAADPNNPGNITYAPKSKAVGMASPQGAGTAAAKTEARSEVPTKIGDQKVAFKTMIAHADLLRTAAMALHNGDQQTLAGLKNRWKNEFGYSGPITAQAIADAYGGEVTNVINKGHITDKGNEKVEHTLDPVKQNFETIDSVLGAYQALAQSKMNMLNQQAQAAKTGKTSTANTPQIQEGATATGPNGHKIRFTQGKWTDAASGDPIQ